MPMYEIFKKQIKTIMTTKIANLFKYKEESAAIPVISAEGQVECHVLSGQCSYLLVGIMEFCMCPHGVQKDRSSFAGLVGGIAGKREMLVGQ